MAIKQTLTGDAAGAVRAVSDLNKALDKMEKGLQLTAKESKQVETAIERIHKANLTPLERMNNKTKELDSLLKAGKLSADEHAKATARVSQQYERAAKSGKDAFGPEMLRGITAAATSVLSVGAAVSGLTAAWRDSEQAAKAAAERTLSSLGAVAELQQLAKGDPAKFAQHVGLQRRISELGIVPAGQEGLASSIAFSAISSGLSKEDEAHLLQLGIERIFKPEEIAPAVTSIGQFQRGSGSKESFARLTDQVIAAAEATPGVSAPQFAQAATRFSSQLAALGFDETEGLAALQIAAQKVSAAEGATQVRGLLNAIDKGGLAQGGSLQASLAGIVSRVDAGENIRAIVGDNQEAIGGYRLLTQSDGSLADIHRNLESAPSIVGKNLLRTDPRLSAADLRQRAEAGSAAAIEERRSEVQNLLSAAFAERQTSHVQAGRSAMRYWDSFQQATTFDFEAERALGRLADDTNVPLSADLLKQIRDLQQRQVDALENRIPVSGRQE